MRVLLILPAIFGIALGGSSGEYYAGYNPLVGYAQGPQGPAVQQNHGAVGNPKPVVGGGGGGSSGQQVFDIPSGAHGPAIVQQHGYNGNPMINYNTGGSSQGNGNGAAQTGTGAQKVNPQVGQNVGGSSQGYDVGGEYAANLNPRIIPSGDDSQDQDYNDRALYGHVPPQSGGQVNAGAAFGGPGGGGNAAAAGAGDDSNSIDPAGGYNPALGTGGNVQYGNGNGNGGAGAAPNAAPVAGGAEMGVMAHHQNYEASSGMSGAAVAGVVAGVVAVGAVGTAVAVVVLKSSASAGSAA